MRGLCGEADEDAITQYHHDERCALNPSASVFATGHGEYFPFSQTTMPAEKPDCIGSYLQFNFCCYQKSSVFGRYYLQGVTLMASSRMEGGEREDFS